MIKTKIETNYSFWDAKAFARGCLNRELNTKEMVLDWDNVADFIVRNKPKTIWAGLNADYEHTKGCIYRDDWYINEGMVYVKSTWAKPIIVINPDEDGYGEDAYECYVMADDILEPNTKKWPKSAINILRGGQYEDFN